MDEEKFWLLLSVKLSGEASTEELDELEQMLQKNPDLGWQAQMLAQLWNKEHSNEEEDTKDFFNRHLQRLSNYPDHYTSLTSQELPEISPDPGNNPYKPYRWLWPMAGVAACITVIVMLFYSNQRSSSKINANKPAAQNTVSTRKGSKSNIQLPDGTLVWLNADSKVTYDENFRGEFREVNLEGEAFFDVVKDKMRPFIIHTKTIDIRVLGTAFNVRAYETEKNTETALFRGSVEVTLHNNPEKKIVLKPNEKLMVNNRSLEVATDIKDENKNTGVSMAVGKVHFREKDSAALESLWIKNKLVFDEEKLEEVALKLERWYDVKVVISGGRDLKYTAYSAIFDNENLEQVMEALKLTGNFSYNINKGLVTIK